MNRIGTNSIDYGANLTLFDITTGIAKPKFKAEMDLVDIIAYQFFSQYDAYHLYNIDILLQENMIACAATLWIDIARQIHAEKLALEVKHLYLVDPEKV